MATRSITRRKFLAKSTLALAAPAFVPSGVLGKNGSVPPSEKIVLGAIGIGPRGRYVLSRMLDEPDVQFVAICDVQASRREAVKAMAKAKYGNNDCAAYIDMHELLARRDIDAVLIATGDRWHALASIIAMNRYGRVFQAGTQRRSISNFKFAAHLAQSGKLGKIHTLHASIYKLRVLYDWLAAEPEPPREIVDWDRWLGPAPWRPYNKLYVQGRWRGYFDFDSGATLLDWGAHTLDLCQWANQADTTAPVSYEPAGDTIYARYANGVKLVLRPGGWMGLGTCPVRFEGDEGWVETGDNGDIALHPASLQAERKIFAIRGTDPARHTRNFFDCMKSRALTAANADVMRHSHIACHAAAIAWQLGRNVTFDPVREEFVGDSEANHMRSRAMRAPWHI